MYKIRLRPLVTAIILSGCSSATFAQLGQNLSVDVRSLSLGNAVTADPPGISAIHFNPAALTKIEGLQTDVQGILANFDIQGSSLFLPAITYLGTLMIRLCVMTVQKYPQIYVQILKGRLMGMLSTSVCIFQY